MKSFKRLSRKSKFGLGLVATYCGYTGYAYVRTQIEIQRRSEVYQGMMGEGLLDEKVKLLDPRFRSMKVLGRFENPFVEYRPQTLFEFLLMRVVELKDFGKRGGLPPTEEKLRETLPIAKPALDLLAATHNGQESVPGFKGLPKLKDRLTYTWLGQSCALLQVSNVSFILDPLFGDVLVNEYVGPKRFTPAPIQLEELSAKTGTPDFVLVSHDHPDHLDLDSVAQLGNKSQWIVPTGLGKFLNEHGVTNVTELDWWDRVPLDVKGAGEAEYEVVCLPAMHWAGRNLLDSNCRLWCSFMLLKDGKSVFYHAGDTGYSAGLFKKLGAEFSPVKFAALPIGQYCPQWHQRPRHISPEESVQIMKDLGCHKMVGVHWGTFVLSSENYLEPGKQLQMLAKKETRPNNIIVPQAGRTMVMDMSKLDFKRDDQRIENEDATVFK